MGFVSYAQNNEDALLNRVFGGQQTGFYVDVGAYHPEIGSVTKSFYDRGWSGINLEPGAIFDELDRARSRDVNLKLVVLDRQGEVNFVQEKDPGMSHVALDSESAGGGTQCDTLANIIAEHGMKRPIDFIKIDAEGAEDAIVMSTDWRAIRPRVLVIESTFPWSSKLANSEWEPHLIQHDYVRVYFDGINCFYVPTDEEPSLRHCFATPINVLDGVVSHETVEMQRRVAEIGALREEREVFLSRMLDTEAMCDGHRAERARLIEGERVALAERDAIAAENAQNRETERNLRAEAEAAWLALATLTEEMTLMTQVGTYPLAAHDAVQPAAPESESPQHVRRPFKRRLARLAFLLVRPIVRPLAWRIRGFVTMILHSRFDTLDARFALMEQRINRPEPQVEGLIRAIDTNTALRNEFVAMAQAQSSERLAMERLAGEIENIVLSMAVLPSRTEPTTTEPSSEGTASTQFPDLSVPVPRGLSI